MSLIIPTAEPFLSSGGPTGYLLVYDFNRLEKSGYIIQCETECQRIFDATAPFIQQMREQAGTA